MGYSVKKAKGVYAANVSPAPTDCAAKLSVAADQVR